jgi:ribosomal-protein-alanine N-acetyltransferase
MTEADAPLVSAIDKASFSLPWPERSFLFEIRENDHSIPLVAEEIQPDGSSILVGFIVVWLIVDEAHIGSVAVDLTRRRSGIAERLIRAALQQARAGGAEKSFLEVRAGNQAALRLYQKLGFKVDGIRPQYYQDNHEDAILMSLGALDGI